MSKDFEKEGGQAFPTIGTDENYFDPGMSLRDWFAGQALNGWCSDPNWTSWADKGSRNEAARRCYDMADAMLEARKS